RLDEPAMPTEIELHECNNYGTCEGWAAKGYRYCTKCHADASVTSVADNDLDKCRNYLVCRGWANKGYTFCLRCLEDASANVMTYTATDSKPYECSNYINCKGLASQTSSYCPSCQLHGLVFFSATSF